MCERNSNKVDEMKIFCSVSGIEIKIENAYLGLVKIQPRTNYLFLFLFKNVGKIFVL